MRIRRLFALESSSNTLSVSAASSTLYALVDELSERNKFTSEKISSGELGSNSPANNEQVIQFLKGKPLDKYFLTKTHFWLDFDGFNISKPSYINLVRGRHRFK